MAAPLDPFNNVPNEILLMILSSVNASDHLSVKLTSKRFLSGAFAIDTSSLTFAQANSCHAAIEAALPRDRPLNCCCCSRCGRVKDKNQFSDRQAAKTRAKRSCIRCCIRNRKYSKRRLPTVSGQIKIPCYGCVAPRPTYRGWKLKSAEATILLGYRGTVIYCQPCLEWRLQFRFPSMQVRNREIARIHADRAYEGYWQAEGV